MQGPGRLRVRVDSLAVPATNCWFGADVAVYSIWTSVCHAYAQTTASSIRKEIALDTKAALMIFKGGILLFCWKRVRSAEDHGITNKSQRWAVPPATDLVHAGHWCRQGPVPQVLDSPRGLILLSAQSHS